MNPITVRQAAQILNLCESSIRSYINQGLIKASKLARKWVIRQEEIDRILDEGVTSRTDTAKGNQNNASRKQGENIQ